MPVAISELGDLSRLKQARKRELVIEANNTHGFMAYKREVFHPAVVPLMSEDEVLRMFEDFDTLKKLQPKVELLFSRAFQERIGKLIPAPELTQMKADIRESLLVSGKTPGELAKIFKEFTKYELGLISLETSKDNFERVFGPIEQLSEKVSMISNALRGNVQEQERVKKMLGVRDLKGELAKMLNANQTVEDFGKTELVIRGIRDTLLVLLDRYGKVMARLQTLVNTEITALVTGFATGTPTLLEAQRLQKVFRGISVKAQSGGIDLKLNTNVEMEKGRFNIDLEAHTIDQLEKLAKGIVPSGPPRTYQTPKEFEAVLRPLLGMDIGAYTGMSAFDFVKSTLDALKVDPTVPEANRHVLEEIVEMMQRGELGPTRRS